MGSARWMNTLCPAGLTRPYSYVCTCMYSIIRPSNSLQLTNLHVSAATSAPKQPLHSTWSTVISSERRHEAAVCACRQLSLAAASISMRRVENRFFFEPNPYQKRGRSMFFLSLIKLFPLPLPYRPHRVRCCVIGLEQKDQPRTSTWLRPSQNLSTPKGLITQVSQSKKYLSPIVSPPNRGARNFLEITVAGQERTQGPGSP